MFTYGELFCGAGGMALGAMQCGFKHAFAADFDNDAITTYIENFVRAGYMSRQDAANDIFCVDLNNDADRKRMRKKAKEKHAEIDCLGFGFPCNSFSAVSTQDGIEDGKFGHLYLRALETLVKFNVKVFVAENVEGILTANGGDDFSIILKAMQHPAAAVYGKDGHSYRVFWRVLNAADYGVAQTRRRALFIGIREDIAKLVESRYELCDDSVFPKTQEGGVFHKTAGAALMDIPANAANHEIKPLTGTALERIKYIRPWENAFNADIPDRLKLNVRGAKISQIYRRLDADRPAYTVTAAGGGGTHMYHWSEHRALTNRERARLQSFPDWFTFHGNYNSVRKQIGMAFPPLVAKAIFLKVKALLTMAAKAKKRAG